MHIFAHHFVDTTLHHFAYFLQVLLLFLNFNISKYKILAVPHILSQSLGEYAATLKSKSCAIAYVHSGLKFFSAFRLQSNQENKTRAHAVVLLTSP